MIDESPSSSLPVPGADDAAGLQDVRPVRDGQGLHGVLLDQQHRVPCSLISLMISKI